MDRYDLESSVIGGCMLSEHAYDRISDLLKPGDFSEPALATIYAAIQALAERHQPIDVITVSDELDANGRLERIGGMATLGEIAHSTPGAANIRVYAERVRDEAVKRELSAAGLRIANADGAGRNGAEMVAEAAETIGSIEAGSVQAQTAVSDYVGRVLERIDQRQSGRPLGLLTGYADIDRMMSGLMPGQLIVLGARPSVGKSALGQCIARNVLRGGGSVLMASLEMTNDEVVERWLAQESRADTRAAPMPDDAWPRITSSMHTAGEWRAYLCDASTLTVPELAVHARRCRRLHGLDLVVVDYLQLMRGTGRSREEEVASISRGLKGLAKALHVPVLALCQLNRAVESRADKRPNLSDLRESGAIEQDADAVWLLHRARDEAIGELIIEKQRNGPIGSCPLVYHAQWSLFETGRKEDLTAFRHQQRQAAKGFDGFHEEDWRHA